MAKEFPVFDRIFFDVPERMFEGWAYDDFAALSKDRNQQKAVSLMPFEGWFSNQGKLFDEVTGNHEWINVSWVHKHDSLNQFITLAPRGINELLFPYNVKINSTSGIKFLPSDSAYKKWNVGASFNHPYTFVRDAMKNVSLPLDKALLVEGFVGTSVEDGIKFPVLKDVDADDIYNLTHSDIPFQILMESLLTLFGRNYDDAKKLHQVSMNVVELAVQVNHCDALKLD